MDRPRGEGTDGVILCVGEDDEAVSLVERALRRDGYAVGRAADAASGLERVGLGGVAAVIAALGPEASSAMDFLRDLTRLAAPPPLVYVAEASDIAVAVNALKAGAADFVVKTAGPDFELQLLAAIRQALERTREQRAADHRAQDEAHDRAMALLEEVNHRVANSLALVVSLVRMQAAATPDASAKSVLAETQARIAAVANLHRTLYAAENVLAVDLATYLTALVEELRHSMVVETHPATLAAQVVSVRVSSEQAVAIGMIVTELTADAVRNAGCATVRLAMERSAGGDLTLSVADDRANAAPSEDQGAALGGRIIQAMTQSLGAELVYERFATGARAVLKLSADRFADLPSGDAA